MSVGCCSAKAVSSPLKGLNIHSLPWACISITDRPIVLELTGGEIRWAPFVQGAVTSVHRWHCALSRLPSFVFHQPLFHRPSDHIQHFTLSPGDAPAQVPTYPNPRIALPSRLPPDQVQSPFSRNFPSIFRSNFSPPSPCSLALCSATLPSMLEMGRGQNSKPLLLESAQSGVARCDVMWWWSPWSSIWGAMSPEDGGTWSSLGLQKAAWRKTACWEEGTARTQAQRQESTRIGFMVCARLEEDASLLTSAAWRPPGQHRLTFVTLNPCQGSRRKGVTYSPNYAQEEPWGWLKPKVPCALFALILFQAKSGVSQRLHGVCQQTERRADEEWIQRLLWSQSLKRFATM